MAEIKNPEWKDGEIIDNFIAVIGKKETACVVLVVQFDDGDKMNARLFLTAASAKRTADTLRDIGWRGNSFADLNEAVLCGLKVNCTIGDQEDMDGNPITNKDGVPYREIKFVNAISENRLKKVEQVKAENIASHFDYLIPAVEDEEEPVQFSEDARKERKNQVQPQRKQAIEEDDDDLPF